MNRRLFLKALCLSPLAPVVLCAKEKPWTFVTAEYNGSSNPDDIEIYGCSPMVAETLPEVEKLNEYSKDLCFLFDDEFDLFTGKRIVRNKV